MISLEDFVNVKLKVTCDHFINFEAHAHVSLRKLELGLSSALAQKDSGSFCL